MKKQPPLPSELEASLITTLEFISSVVTNHPRTCVQVLTDMELNAAAFNDEIDTLENLLASMNEAGERIVPRLAEKQQKENNDH
jgi:hypothetical protein